MTPEELKELRKSLGLTQAEFAERIGMKVRAYADIELGVSPVRPIHVLATERVALSIAVERRNPMLAPASVRKEALELAQQIIS